MRERISGNDYSPKAMRGREKDLKKKFGSNIGICDPQNITLVRVNDLVTTIIDYKKQLASIKDPDEIKVIRGRIAEAVRQIPDGL